jgi:Bacterial Ig-like domain
MTRARGILALWLVIAGCSRAPEPFRVIAVAPAPGSAPLRLNESITIRFSRAVDPSSVHPESIHLADATGRRARGEWRVGGDRITFRAAPPTAFDLADGGFAPGSTVRLRIAGFPGRDGVLAINGDPLVTAFAGEYVVVAVSDSGDAACVDAAPGEPARLINADALRGPARVAPEGVVKLLFSEPLAPRSVVPEAFELRFANESRDLVPCQVELRQDAAHCAVMVRPVAGFQPDTRYLLAFSRERSVRDLGGLPLDDQPAIALEVTRDGAAVLGDDSGSR